MSVFQKIAASLLLLICGYFLLFTGVNADEFTSTDYKLLEPVMGISGGYSTSDDYQLIGSIGQVSVDRSESADFGVRGGWLEYSESAATAVAQAITVSEGAGIVTGGGPILKIFEKLIKKTVLRGSTGDLNIDGSVNLRDVSVLLYWWQKPLQQNGLVPQLATLIGLGRPSPDLNKDGKVNIVDLSLLLSRWTG